MDGYDNAKFERKFKTTEGSIKVGGGVFLMGFYTLVFIYSSYLFFVCFFLENNLNIFSLEELVLSTTNYNNWAIYSYYYLSRDASNYFLHYLLYFLSYLSFEKSNNFVYALIWSLSFYCCLFISLNLPSCNLIKALSYTTLLSLFFWAFISHSYLVASTNAFLSIFDNTLKKAK